MNLEGRVAIVVGGSSGIGAATVRMLADGGATVAIGYNSGVERAEALRASLPGEGHSVFRIAVDQPDSVVEAAGGVLAGHGRADILVNSAGTTRPVPHADLDGLDDALLDEIMASNVQGPFATIRAFAPALKASGDAVIVNISSISGFTGSGSNVGYCASKGALDTMTLSLARALGPEIRVLAVSPGAVATDFVAGRDRTALEAIAAKTPLKRVVEPDDVARTVMACITHLTATTGARIICDGGRFLV
ncbi:3-ketoacyl-ACP reductase [Novosphingobium endophyticum]|uniref:3-ketoacyl-ACP reductase n=1 Tax=Novosphingobium endophyticum TaxID=1955250 RepID=A0A916TUW9_9SPHN|nr:SDR family oxidoreductase [Novosphingobium endophyticum]GGC01338.1 3-ketoacyl-ACP reductase [Novosphingobium endophyticum]